MRFRPERLIAKVAERCDRVSLYGRSHRAVGLVDKEFLGDQEVIAIETTSHTLVVEGLASHNCYLSNFWRAVSANPSLVARHADYPVNEADLHARHRWLVAQDGFRERMRSDPDYFDARIAGWWAWGLSCWIGGGWCSVDMPNGEVPSEGGAGVHRRPHQRRISLGGRGGGNGCHSQTDRRPNMGGAGGGQGVQSPSVTRETAGLEDWFLEFQARLRRVRVCCGDWRRVVTPAVLKSHGGPTGVLLDPPYADDLRARNLYAVETDVSREVREWAIANGDDPDLRLVLCGYDNELPEMPPTWRVREWKTSGGYARTERGRENRHRERLWFSPACLIGQRDLFA